MVTFNSFIVNFIFAIRLGFSKPQLNHVLSFIHGIILADGRKTVSQIRRSTNEIRDLSCMTRFLNESPWCVKKAYQRRIKFILSQIKKSHAQSGDNRPIVYVIIDDSQCKKERSTVSMEGLDNHFSHSEGKSIWSHYVVMHILCLKICHLPTISDHILEKNIVLKTIVPLKARMTWQLN